MLLVEMFINPKDDFELEEGDNMCCIQMEIDVQDLNILVVLGSPLSLRMQEEGNIMELLRRFIIQ